MSVHKFTLPIADVFPGMLAAEEINILNKYGASVMHVKLGTPLSDEILRRLARHKVTEVVVAHKNALIIETPPVKPILDEAVREKAVDNIRDLFGAIGDSENMTTAYHAVKELDDVVDQLVDSLTSETESFVHIADLKSFDEYTYHHSLSVAVLSIAIGTGIGLSTSQLKKLGQCAILHDIGKTQVPIEILNKPGRLTDEEFEIIKEHAEKSGEYLARLGIGDQELWSAVSHHHEKLDGSGYPSGLAGDDIPLYSKIISIADVYDAVTSYRPYRKPMAPSEAIEIIMSEIGRSFEYRLVKIFVDKLDLYPPNSVVQLTDGRQGIVVDNTDSVMRPVLKMLEDGSEIDLMGLDNLSLIIEKVVDGFEDN